MYLFREKQQFSLICLIIEMFKSQKSDSLKVSEF